MIEGIFGSGLASQLDKHLWQGGFPSEPSKVKAKGFQAIVLCAAELQPVDQDDIDQFGIEVICAPMDDREMNDRELRETLVVAGRAAKRVVALLRRNQTVLVSCMAGRNRSGLVSALSLTMYRNISPERAISHIKRHRPNALTNQSFCRALRNLQRFV